VLGHALHQPNPQPTPAQLVEHEDVAHVGERRVVADDARKAGLAPGLGVQPEVQRALDAAPHDVERHAARPVRLLGQPAMDRGTSSSDGSVLTTNSPRRHSSAMRYLRFRAEERERALPRELGGVGLVDLGTRVVEERVLGAGIRVELDLLPMSRNPCSSLRAASGLAQPSFSA